MSLQNDSNEVPGPWHTQTGRPACLGKASKQRLEDSVPVQIQQRGIDAMASARFLRIRRALGGSQCNSLPTSSGVTQQKCNMRVAGLSKKTRKEVRWHVFQLKHQRRCLPMQDWSPPGQGCKLLRPCRRRRLRHRAPGVTGAWPAPFLHLPNKCALIAAAPLLPPKPRLQKYK